ncbi:MAG: hypothetical protein J07HX64_01553 [halophilic archaeon J07HX64]|nr:MAG: hypothetical protein J07HX64_01553 [halophilic archaeon J07HX64]
MFDRDLGDISTLYAADRRKRGALE